MNNTRSLEKYFNGCALLLRRWTRIDESKFFRPRREVKWRKQQEKEKFYVRSETTQQKPFRPDDDYYCQGNSNTVFFSANKRRKISCSTATAAAMFLMMWESISVVKHATHDDDERTGFGQVFCTQEGSERERDVYEITTQKNPNSS